MIRVLVADDEPAVLGALADLIDREPGMTIVSAVEDAEHAVAAASDHRPDVALLDVRMPGGGAAAVRAITDASPVTKVLALSAERDRATVLDMLEAGSVGYLTKGCAVETILESIVRAASGEASLSHDVTADVIDEAVDRAGTNRAAQEQRQQVLTRIEKALGPDGFHVVFQPIVELASRSPIGMEALSRFPAGSPDRWFSDAAEVGLGADLELAAVERALPAFAALPTDTFMTVNVSPSTVMTPRFHTLVASAPRGRLVVELTEHAEVSNYDGLNESLDVLRDEGLRVAIDDAGAGFASLRHILRLAPDLIKLDRTLVKEIDSQRSQQALAQGLTSFADGIDATIIAEGIERPEEIDVLERLGVTLGQGFYLARPGLLDA